MSTVTGLSKGTIDPSSDEAAGRFLKGFVGGGAERAVDLGARTVEGRASTINLDRDGEVILPSALEQTLPAFIGTSAPFLAAHSHRGGDGRPTQIGWVLEGQITKTDVRCTFRYARTGAAEDWWALASDPDGKGHAFSIGFRPIRWIYGTPEELVAAYPELGDPLRDAGVGDEARIRVYVEIELYEISAVPVPSNRQAMMVLAAKAFGVEAEDADAALDALAGNLAERLAGRIAVPPAAAEAAVDTEKLTDLLTGFRLEADRMEELLAVCDLPPAATAAPAPPAVDAGTRAAGDEDGADLEALKFHQHKE